jgi:hypothetical protein
VENEFTARTDNRLRFHGTVMPASRGASLRQVWFDRGDTRYLMTQCVGGNCVRPSGLAVLRGEEVLMNPRCAALPRPDPDSFDRELVRFGSNVEASRLNTPLPELGEYDNPPEKIDSSGRRR